MNADYLKQLIVRARANKSSTPLKGEIIRVTGIQGLKQVSQLTKLGAVVIFSEKGN